MDLYDRLEADPNDPNYNDLAGEARNEPQLGYELNGQGQTSQRGELDEPLRHAVCGTGGGSDESDNDLLFLSAQRVRDPNPPPWWEYAISSNAFLL